MTDPNSDANNAPPAIRDHPTWNSGDFALVTPDGVRFRVDERYLRAASDVFNDLIKDGQGDREVVLLDPDLEHSDIVSIWLNLVINAELQLAPTQRNRITQATQIVHLIDFLDKWSSTNFARKTFLLHLRSGPGICPLNRFVGAALMGLPDLCADTLQSYYKGISDNTSLKTIVADRGRGEMDLTMLEFSIYKRIPLSYQWALAQTLNQQFKTPLSNQVRSKFLKFVNDAEQPPSHPAISTSPPK